MLLASGKDS